MHSMNRGTKSVLSLAGVVSAALLACGCSLGVSDSSSSATSAPTSPSTANAPVSSASTSPRDTNAAPPSSAAPGQGAGITDPDWLDALSRAEREISADDADDIVGDNQVLRVAVDCPEVEITGSNNTVVARTAPR